MCPSCRCVPVGEMLGNVGNSSHISRTDKSSTHSLRGTMIQQWWLLLLAVVSIFSSSSHQSITQKRQCVFMAKAWKSEFAIAGNVSDSVQTCENTHCCVGYFLIVDGRPEVDVLACDIVEKSCPTNTCKGQIRKNNKVIKCVCNSDLCNAEVDWSPGSEEQQEHKEQQEQQELQEQQPTDSYPVGTLIIILLGIGIGIVSLSLGVVALCLRCPFQKKNQNSSFHDSRAAPLCSCLTTKTSEIDGSKIHLQQMLSRGDFATVWKGRYQGSKVLLKVFPSSRKHGFLTEKEVYELPLMKHANVATYVGSGTGKVGEDETSCFIVLRCSEYDSLHAFLSGHTNNWRLSLKLCQSISKGLSYLHSDLNRHDLHKPPVAHRNLSSFSVLVKADGSCVLSEFFCSTVLRRCSRQQQVVTRTNHLVTWSYTPPEVLEGSVNLNSSWCLQGDVYSLGLIMWEVLMRCLDLFEGHDVPLHAIPYEAELGSMMTYEQLTWHVSHLEERPSVPIQWGPGLTELLMECWDTDPDARLTSQCVVQRLEMFESRHIPSFFLDIVE